MSTEQNKALVCRFLDALWNQKQVSVIDALFDASYIDHNAATPSVGVEAFKQLVSGYLDAFPDLRCSIEDQIAEGDRVATRVTYHGTHGGPLLGLAPTGLAVMVTGIEIACVAADKIVEGWSEFDALGMLHQLGAAPHLHTEE